MISSFLAATLVLGAIDVQVETIDGEMITVQVASLDANQLTYLDGRVKKSLPTGNLLSVLPRNTRHKSTANASHYVTLVDETYLPADHFQQSGDDVQMQLLSRPYELNTKQLRAVRLYRQGSMTDSEWEAILAQEHPGDAIVIRKGDETLTFLEGVIEGVDEDSVKFRFEGDTLDVKKTKLEGWIYYRPAGKELPVPVCTIANASGARIQVHGLQSAGNQLKIITPSGMHLTQSWSTIGDIRFATDNLVYLSDLEPIDTVIRPWIGGGQLQPALVRMMYSPKRDVSLHGEPLSLVVLAGRRAETFAKGISLHSQTRITYRLPGKFKRLAGLAGIDPAVGNLGNVQLSVQVADKVLYDRRINGGQPAVSLNVNLNGASRVTIVADYADGSDVGDYLNLCDLKVTK